MNGDAPLTEFQVGIVAAIRIFQTVISSRNGDEVERLSLLARALDGLVQQYNLAPQCEPDDGPDAPRVESPSMLQEIGETFPTLALYADIDPSNDFDQQPGVGDAIDDLGDMARDLSDVLWYFERGRPDTAIWDFRFGYQSHWGRHLHDLRRHLHHRLN